jgi:ABC-type sugar transport system substrate-binding protein
MVLAPIDDTALKRPVAAAMQKGIPVVIMDSALKGEPVKDFVSTVTFALKKVRQARVSERRASSTVCSVVSRPT